MDGGSWADQWDTAADPTPEKKKSGGAAAYGKKVGEKTKSAATTGVKKVKEGTSVGFQRNSILVARNNEDAVSVIEPEIETSVPEIEPAVEAQEPKREEVFAVVMVGGRQYIVFPGRYIYTQRLKGANVNDKITLNKVLLVGTKTSAYIGKPIVPNATVQAVVEEQALDKKVIVFKYKKKKNYRRNIGHRQPITRIRITSITGYQDSPVTTLEE